MAHHAAFILLFFAHIPNEPLLDFQRICIVYSFPIASHTVPADPTAGCINEAHKQRKGEITMKIIKHLAKQNAPSAKADGPERDADVESLSIRVETGLRAGYFISGREIRTGSADNDWVNAVSGN